ncbi:MAG: cation transporter, partial [Betaproteobacteria bacterium]
MNDTRIVPKDTDEYTLLIEGMTCASCVSRLERVLYKVPGVLDASVNLATEKARIHALGVPVSALITAVQKAGFDAQLEPTMLTASVG